MQLQPMPLHRLFHHIGQLRAQIGLFLRARVRCRHGHARLARQYLDRLHELHILGFAHKGDRVPLGVATKAIVEPFAVIDVKTGGFFLMERARRPHVALALIGLAGVPHHFTPHDL